MTPIDTLDTVVIGAGVVGLACARALARRGCEVVVLEALGAVARSPARARAGARGGRRRGAAFAVDGHR